MKSSLFSIFISTIIFCQDNGLANINGQPQKQEQVMQNDQTQTADAEEVIGNNQQTDGSIPQNITQLFDEASILQEINRLENLPILYGKTQEASDPQMVDSIDISGKTPQEIINEANQRILQLMIQNLGNTQVNQQKSPVVQQVIQQQSPLVQQIRAQISQQNIQQPQVVVGLQSQSNIPIDQQRQIILSQLRQLRKQIKQDTIQIPIVQPIQQIKVQQQLSQLPQQQSSQLNVSDRVQTIQIGQTEQQLNAQQIMAQQMIAKQIIAQQKKAQQMNSEQMDVEQLNNQQINAQTVEQKQIQTQPQVKVNDLNSFDQARFDFQKRLQDQFQQIQQKQQIALEKKNQLQ